MARVPDLPCATCGKLMWSGKTSAPQGEARCLPCRRSVPERHRKQTQHACEHCGDAFAREGSDHYRYCSRKCFGAHRRVRADDHADVQHKQRLSRAPGLGQAQRNRLRQEWLRQQRQCTYCTVAATTIDHVLPLVRGGTNYEGNLTPACGSCNSSKSGKTITEWRHGVSLGKVRHAPDWMATRIRQDRECARCSTRFMSNRENHLYCSERCRAKASAARASARIRGGNVHTEKPCLICGMPTNRPVYCSFDCRDEGNRRIARERYRASVGLAPTFERPVRRRASVFKR